MKSEDVRQRLSAGSEHPEGSEPAIVKAGVAARVKTAWASFAGVPQLEPLHVLVDPDSALAPPGWIGIVVIAGTITASVPSRRVAQPVAAALTDVARGAALDAARVLDYLPPISQVVGPAALFYAPAPLAPPDHPPAVEEASPGVLESLLRSVPDEEREESGVGTLRGPVFIVRSADGSPVAACGYRAWPEQIAHVCVLTHPSYRRRGLAEAVARVAISHGLAGGRLPQWRARWAPSIGLARKLGLVELGAQLCLQLES